MALMKQLEIVHGWVSVAFGSAVLCKGLVIRRVFASIWHLLVLLKVFAERLCNWVGIKALKRRWLGCVCVI
jgi:hypothetical protein